MRVDCDGVGVHVVIDGPADGPPVVALHGITNSMATYDFLPAELPDHRLIRLDLRGHGQSDRAAGHYLIGDYARDAEAVLEQVVGGPATLVGHSLGGMIVALIAQRRPDLVTPVFLEDAGLYAGDPDWMEVTGFGAKFVLAGPDPFCPAQRAQSGRL